MSYVRMDEEGLVLIDTSAWILALRPDGLSEARQALSRLIAEGRAAISNVILLELLSGARTEREFKELKEELEALIWLEVRDGVWERAYRLAYRARREGLTVPSLDILIAALAAEHNCGLLHADRHFILLVDRGLVDVRLESLLSERG